jgi:transcriptional regulator with XRE-family HTH domain
MVIKERREIISWNSLANRTADQDLGNLTQFQRSVLRMAATRHFDRHLKNWDELIGGHIAILKSESEDDGLTAPPLWIQAVLDSIGREEDPADQFLPRVFNLFLSVERWREERRNVHPVRWVLDDGTDLAFHAAIADWNNYDGLWAFDWHAANGETAAWVESQRAAPVTPSQRPAAKGFPEFLQSTRRDANLSRTGLASLSGLSAPSIRAYESGQRSPSRTAIMALTRALNIDGYETNRLLREAGFEEEPSDFARWLSGDTSLAIYRGRHGHKAAGARAMFRECDRLTWPAAVLDAGCHVVSVNPLMERLVRLSRWQAIPNRPGPHLLQLMVSEPFQQQIRNWEDVATVILPGRLEAQVLGARLQASRQGLRVVSEHVRRANADGLSRLDDIWHRSAGVSSLQRPGVRFEWTTESGDELTFNCTISGWNSYDPYKALDLYPADQKTFSWLEGR